MVDGDAMEELSQRAIAVFEKLQTELCRVFSGKNGAAEAEKSIEKGLAIDIPKVLDVIGQQENSDELRAELQEAIMKAYWDGFYTGFSNGKSS